MKRMKRDNTLIWIAAIITLALSVLLHFTNGQVEPTIIKQDTIVVHDTLWNDTTIIEREFVTKVITKMKVDTVFNSLGDTMELVTESKRYDKSLVIDKDTADVEIYTSGINTSLDSLKMRLRTHSITNTIEITKYVERKKTFKDRFHFGLQGGVGYGLTQRNVDVYVGIGGSFDL